MFARRAIGMVWVFRWSEEVNGQRRQHKEVIGATKEFPTEATANREAPTGYVVASMNKSNH
jgi:hypothetical protein